MGPCPFRHGNWYRAIKDFARTVLLQWGHVLSDMVTGGRDPCRSSPDPASMGPCPFRHGNRVHPRHGRAAAVHASMGPCPFRHGNPPRRKRRHSRRRRASMGPCPFRHGNSGVPVSGYIGTDALQWGHVLSDMVTHKRGISTLVIDYGLQWGHVLSDMVTQIPVTPGDVVIQLQWGHVLSDMVTEC